MRADVGVPNVALAVQARHAREPTVVVDVDELHRMGRQTRDERIDVIRPRLCFPILRIRLYADSTPVCWNAGVPRTAFDDDDAFLCKWIGLMHSPFLDETSGLRACIRNPAELRHGELWLPSKPSCRKRDNVASS